MGAVEAEAAVGMGIPRELAVVEAQEAVAPPVVGQAALDRKRNWNLLVPVDCETRHWCLAVPHGRCLSRTASQSLMGTSA